MNLGVRNVVQRRANSSSTRTSVPSITLIWSRAQKLVVQLKCLYLDITSVKLGRRHFPVSAEKMSVEGSSGAQFHTEIYTYWSASGDVCSYQLSYETNL